MILKKGDAIELLKSIKPNTVDLCLTDPPYNIADSHKLTKSKGKIQSITNIEKWNGSFVNEWNTFEDYTDWLINVMKLIDKTLKPDGSIIIFLNRKYTGYFIYRFEKELNWIFKSKFYFKKRNEVPHIMKNNYLSSIEEAVWFVKTSNKYTLNFLSQKEMKPVWDFNDMEIQLYLQTYWEGNIGSGKISNHPTEKYSWMIYPLLRRHTKRGQTVMDPFMGSGSIGVISKRMGLDFIGFEREDKYFKDAEIRINNTITTSNISIKDFEIEE